MIEQHLGLVWLTVKTWRKKKWLGSQWTRNTISPGKWWIGGTSSKSFFRISNYIDIIFLNVKSEFIVVKIIGRRLFWGIGRVTLSCLPRFHSQWRIVFSANTIMVSWAIPEHWHRVHTQCREILEADTEAGVHTCWRKDLRREPYINGLPVLLHECFMMQAHHKTLLLLIIACPILKKKD